MTDNIASRAWIFAAGLLLGFWTFVQCDKTDTEASEAFRQSRDALQKMSAFSPQARHYFQILSALNDAVELHRVTKAEERKRWTSQYVDQVLTFDSSNSLSDDTQAAGAEMLQDKELSDAFLDGDPSSSWNLDMQHDQADSCTPLGTGISQEFPWPADDLDIDWEPFAPFLGDLV